MLADLLLLHPAGGDPVMVFVTVSDAGLCAADMDCVVGNGHSPVLDPLVVGMTMMAAAAVAAA